MLFKIKPFYKEFTQNSHVVCTVRDHNFNLKKEYLTKVIIPHGPRSNKFSDAIQKEVFGFMIQNTWEVVLSEDVSKKKAAVLGGRFVLAIKDEGAFKEI